MKKFMLVFLILLVLPCCNSGEEREQPAQAPAGAEPAPEERRFDYTFEAEGKKFGTYLSPRYGANDVWLAYAADGENYTDVFTGCALGPGAWKDSYSAAYADGKVVISYERAMSMGADAQQTQFAATLDELERDSDKDGLADVSEYRLMTDAANSDTDGDGKKDGEDDNPLASGRIKLAEHQKIWKTAFVQYQKERVELLQLPAEGVVLAVFESEADFFELGGREDPVLAVTDERLEKFGEQFGFYVPQVYFRSISHITPTTEKDRRRVSFVFEVILEPLLGRAYKLTLERRDGEWKLIDAKLERMY